jgi:hypothetical protein
MVGLQQRAFLQGINDSIASAEVIVGFSLYVPDYQQRIY